MPNSVPTSAGPRAGSALVRRSGALLFLLVGAAWANAGPLLDRWRERRDERAAERNPGIEQPARTLPGGATVRREIAYGADDAQRLDVYLLGPGARRATPAPIVFMVHGGAWKIGDKSHGNVVRNKAARWVPAGFVFVSVNYRLHPHADALAQADDIARALAFVQRHAADWGGDPARVILMGHSAGAHLVGLVSAHPTLAAQAGAQPWLGSVLLDSAALDLVEIMGRPHYDFYDDVFGRNPEFWRKTSPYHVLARPVPAILAVCSKQRRDSPVQAERFAARAKELGSPVVVLEVDLDHGEINDELGRPGAYTASVEDFLRSLDPAVAARLPKE